MFLSLLLPLSDSTNSPIILKCNKYGPVVHVVIKQIDQRKFTPMFEGLIVKRTVVVSRASWYGYYGRIKGFGCQGCSLYIREILPDGYSAFSARTAIELSGSSRETYFTVEAINTGFRLRWQSETAIVISYTNMLTKRTAMIPSEKQDLVEHTLTELDSCTPYKFVGLFANSQDSEPWQTITITTDQERSDHTFVFLLFNLEPNITLFKAVSPTKTVLMAEWVTAGHCPLVYLINGIQYDAPIPRRFFGSPLLVTVTKEMGAILEPMKNGNYKVEMSYEIYNDPGCDKRFICLVPSVDGSQIKAATTAVRRIGFGMKFF
ncbi:hypothetical protein FGIG_04070 [Fasciola gigantica]|uniref:Uncharacterized protein n=1 Tax=Fasciola gigantica TaxID=46835 RepID=A0A504YHG4_FASGI|nr:hypothetical protein FGIG_04070 [Fasciola gigantica]